MGVGARVGATLLRAMILARLLPSVLVVAVAATQDAPALPAQRTWMVDGVEQHALVAVPSPAPTAATPTPLVFVFHGHGGRSAAAARGFRLHELLPQAVVVYPQGLPTPGRLTDRSSSPAARGGSPRSTPPPWTMRGC